MPPPDPSPSTYPLSRSHRSTTRLIAQHALWQHDLRFLLHPTMTSTLLPSTSSPSAGTHAPALTNPLANPPPSSSTSSSLLPPSSPLHIADLATGTALWPLSLLQQYPDAQITASDISLAQCPPPTWLPPGLQLQEWDMYTPVPESWIGAFDVVHIRLALLAVRANDTQTVLAHALAMLKPGGWMQWDELDPEGASTIVAEGAEGVGVDEVQRFQRMQELSDFAGLRWVRSLEGAFAVVGFEAVGKQIFEGDKGIGWFFQGLQFTVMEEQGGVERVRDDVEWGVQFSRKGVARVVPKVVVWGRKPVGGGKVVD